MPINGSGFFIEFDTLTIPIFNLGRNLPGHVEEELLNQAQAVLAYAQENAPCTDRSGEARAGLDVGVDHDGLSVELELFHTVDYGLWLEVIQSGRFAIIMPTLEAFASQVMGSVGAERTG